MSQLWEYWNLGVEDRQKLGLLEPSRFLVASLSLSLSLFIFLSLLLSWSGVFWLKVKENLTQSGLRKEEHLWTTHFPPPPWVDPVHSRSMAGLLLCGLHSWDTLSLPALVYIFPNPKGVEKNTHTQSH